MAIPHELDGRGRWLVIRGFCSHDEVCALQVKLSRHFARGELLLNPCGPCRFFAKADESPATYVNSLITELTSRCERMLGLQGVPADNVLGRTLSLLQPGGFIHRHRDAYQPSQPGHRPGLDHLRANVVVRVCL
jgi:hypothetical protein